MTSCIIKKPQQHERLLNIFNLTWHYRKHRRK